MKLPARIVIALVTLVPPPAAAAPDRAEYDLQEKCGRRAAEVFEKINPETTTNDANGQSSVSYRNHYDPDINKCFMLQTTMYVGRKDGVRIAWKDELLIDVNENKEYGEIIKNTVDSAGNILKPDDDSGLLICNVWGLHCVSERQWDQMIGRSMGDTE